MCKQLSFILILISLNACTEKEKKVEKYFDTFEMSYCGGKGAIYHLKIDTNQHYYYQIEHSFKEFETFHGSLNDSLFNTINLIAYKIKIDSTIVSNENLNYFDHPEIAVYFKKKNKLYTIHQSSNVDTIFNGIINKLLQFEDKKYQIKIDTTIDFKTRYWIASPPPLKPPVKFQKRKTK